MKNENFQFPAVPQIVLADFYVDFFVFFATPNSSVMFFLLLVLLLTFSFPSSLTLLEANYFSDELSLNLGAV